MKARGGAARALSRRSAAIAAALLSALIALGFAGRIWFPLDLLAHLRLHFAIAAAATGVAALALGQRVPAAWAAAAAAAGIIGLGPALREAERPTPTAAERVTVAFANVDIHNQEREAVAAALAALGADVLVTAETHAEWRDDPVLNALYPHVVNRVRWIYTGVWVWSKRPILSGWKRDGAGDAPRAAFAEIPLDRAVLRLLGLHFERPIQGRQRDQIMGAVGLSRQASRPLVVVGDFNATPWSAAVSRFAEAAAVQPVGGLRMTWRSDYAGGLGPLAPALTLPIDHLLVSSGVGVDEVETFHLPGSDHRGLIARLAIPLRPDRGSP